MTPRAPIAGPDGKVHPGTVFRVEGTGEVREVVAVLRAEDVPVSDLLRSTAAQVARHGPPLVLLMFVLAGCAVTYTPGSFPRAIPRPPSVAVPELWVHGNTGSADLLSLLADRAGWPTVAARVSTVQLHSANLIPGCVNRACGPNLWERVSPLLPALVASGTALAVEDGALKEWDCQGTVLRQQVVGTLQRVREAGALMSAVSMDWPFSGGHACGLSHADAASVLARFAAAVEAEGASVILTTGYPSFDVAHHLEHLDALEAAGVRLSAVHLDIDLPAVPVRAHGSGEVRELTRAIRARGLTVGLIVTGWDGRSTSTWSQTARETARVVLQDWLNCDIDRVVVESWAQVGSDPARAWMRLWPLNVPETNPDTLTGLARTEACA